MWPRESDGVVLPSAGWGRLIRRDRLETVRHRVFVLARTERASALMGVVLLKNALEHAEPLPGDIWTWYV
jgi:hypothetical protein